MKRFNRPDIISEDFSRETLEAMFRYGESNGITPIAHTMSLPIVRKATLTPYQKKCYTRMYRLRLADKKRFTNKSAYLYEQIKLQKKDNHKKLKAVERCLKRVGSLQEAELELRIPVDELVDLEDVSQDEVPENPYRVKEDVVVAEPITEPVVDVTVDEVVAEVGVIAEACVTDVSAVAETAVVDSETVCESDINMTEDVSSGWENGDVLMSGDAVRLPDNKADYVRMSVAEKVRCYQFDDKGMDEAFEMVRTYFEKIGMDTSFHSVYEEKKFLIDYYEEQKAEEVIRERMEQIIGRIELLGINVGKFMDYPAEVLSVAFGFRDMEYFTGIKLFNRVIDRLGVDMDQQKRYEVFDEIYEEEMREKKVERNGRSR